MKPIDRRGFLQTAGAAAVSASISGAAPGRIRVGILGTQHSHFSGKLKVMLDSPDYEVVAVCEPDSAARMQRQANPLYRSLNWVTEETLLGDASIQLVVVECRVWEAVPFGRKVIAANKHLHLEKPPTHEMAPFRELVEESRRKKLLLQMGYIWSSTRASRPPSRRRAKGGWVTCT